MLQMLDADAGSRSGCCSSASRPAACATGRALIIGRFHHRTDFAYLTDPSPAAAAPGWSREFDGWAAERFAAGDLDALIDFRAKAPR